MKRGLALVAMVFCSSYSMNTSDEVWNTFKKSFPSLALALEKNDSKTVRNTIHKQGSNTLTTPLVWTLYHNAPNILHAILKHGVNPNKMARHKESLIHTAFTQNRIHMIPILLRYGANANTTTANNFSPIHRACIEGKLSLVKLLLDYQADPNAKTTMRHTPLHIAITRNYPDIVELLLKKGADPNDPLYNNSISPLHYACREGLETIVELLLKHKAETDARDSLGETPLHHASEHGYLAIVKKLIAYGARTNVQDWDEQQTPLHSACLYNRAAVADYLLSHSANPNICNRRGWTPLLVAIIGQNHDIITMLVHAGTSLEKPYFIIQKGKRRLVCSSIFTFIDLFGLQKPNIKTRKTYQALKTYLKSVSQTNPRVLKKLWTTNKKELLYDIFVRAVTLNNQSLLLYLNSLDAKKFSFYDMFVIAAYYNTHRSVPFILSSIDMNKQGFLKTIATNDTRLPAPVYTYLKNEKKKLFIRRCLDFWTTSLWALSGEETPFPPELARLIASFYARKTTSTTKEKTPGCFPFLQHHCLLM